MKRTICFILIACSFFVLFNSCKTEQKDNLYTIGIIQLIDSPILDTSRVGIIQGLAEKGFVEGKNIKINYINAQGDMGHVPMILKSFITEKVDLIITITTPCMVAATQLVKDIPVVFTVAFSPAQMGIKKTPKNITGISDPMDMTEFIALVKNIIPDVKTVGTIYNNAEANSVYATNKMTAECKKNNLDLQLITVNGTNDIPQAAEVMAMKKVQAFLISADNTVNAGLQSLIKVAEKYKIPIFSTSVDLVRQGICAGIGSNYKQWGISGGHMGAAILKGAKPEDFPVKDVESYTTNINLKAAEKQGVKFSEEIIKSADKVYNN